MSVETATVIVWWLRRGPVIGPLLLDVPAGVGAILASAALTEHSPMWPGYVLWTGFAFPYTVVVAFTFGLVYRTPAAAITTGVVWGGATFAGAVWLDHRSLTGSLFVVVPYLIYPVVCGTSAGLLGTGLARIEAAREAARRQAAELATETERIRHARALHDRVLQTMEALLRGRVVADAGLHERLATEAAWLRRFVETGQDDQAGDLSVGLAAAARAITDDGVAVEYHDATLRTGQQPRLSDEGREALIEGTHGALADLTARADSVVVRAQRHEGGVLVTILVRGPLVAGAETGLDRIRARLSLLGGRLTVEPTPYAELWVPAADGQSADDGAVR
jgi:hypothetical protein